MKAFIRIKFTYNLNIAAVGVKAAFFGILFGIAKFQL